MKKMASPPTRLPASPERFKANHLQCRKYCAKQNSKPSACNESRSHEFSGDKKQNNGLIADRAPASGPDRCFLHLLKSIGVRIFASHNSKRFRNPTVDFQVLALNNDFFAGCFVVFITVVFQSFVSIP